MLFRVWVLLHLLPSGRSACVGSPPNTHEAPGEQQVFVEEGAANSFLSRRLQYNRFDFEMFVPGNLERECYEEVCNYEEAREVFENIPQTDAFWKTYISDKEKPGRVDVTALLVGLIAGGVVIVIVGLLIWYYCQGKMKGRVSRGPSVRARRRRSNASLIMRRLEEVSSQPVHPPGSPPEPEPLPPPSYEQAISRSGQHDAPPPPYPGSRHGSVRR